MPLWLKNLPTGRDNLLPLGAKVAQVVSELNTSADHGGSRRAQHRPAPSWKVE